MKFPEITNNWKPIIEKEMEKPYFRKLRGFLEDQYAHEVVYPAKEDIFNALKYVDFKKVKVVILGQDPYHGPGQAHGLSFSVQPQEQIPPSLKNIFKELQTDLGCDIPNNGYLKKWADQGVLLLNTVLTVRKSEAHSHRDKGWELFTDQLIAHLNERENPVIFILWGKPAQSKLKIINTNKHLAITSPHPSPLSARRGFFGSRPFSKVNEYLRELNEKEIDWQIESL
ncbi:uracil-DNA glycosylase [Mesobacillus harenae]|uniref:uracil-DNA glycosylase n=1 Tax=Mesobacillus harenae TaxID=2213203 RepID=UPI0015800BE1|nr:uracil-DNA glycosylase [Mesobacillus harenae]